MNILLVNKKPNRLQKPAIQQNEEEEVEIECVSADIYANSISWVGKGVILMQSEDEWEVAGVSFVHKLFYPGTEPVYQI